MRKILLKDLIIPKGTVFIDAAVKTERLSSGCMEATIGLPPNTFGTISYWCDEDENELAKWFVDDERENV